ncbi:RNA polymerase sigma factor [Pedobacter sp. L105]|uniref:RNA polymerase sigma factor n=1 Tax=Pedobacter sp. L105 TaxID=1641871 RepID=UPI00131A8701|nr:sigma-70 family RNA polymerase sigma factor [Pedobacter sp. L105]
MQEKETDLALISAVLNGNTAVYSELVKRHQRFVFTLALRFTKNREDAEEVAQDCFIKAYRALGTFRQTSKFSTWLYSITYTSAMTHLRKKKPETVSLSDDENPVQLADPIADTHDMNAEKRSAYFYLNQAIDSLSADDAAIITLFYKGEQSLEEIGKTVHLTPNSVKVKLHRARLKLKEKLQYLLKDEVKELI